MIKIVSGFTGRGGSTVALINLCNYFNNHGYDCVFYGDQEYHLDKCKSGRISHDLKYEKDDIIIAHFLNIDKRPDVKKIVLASHEKWWYPVGKIKKFWDTVVFLHEEHRKYHKDYIGDFTIIPNLKEDLTFKNKDELDMIAGVIGTIEDRKQTHISIQRALKDKCEKIYLFGHIGDENYFNNKVKPLLLPRVKMVGHINNKQEMYDSIGRVYHSSKGEVACLVKDECYSTNTKFFGNEETDNKVSELSNKEVLNLWEILLEL